MLFIASVLRICDRAAFARTSKKRNREYASIQYAMPGTPAENSNHLIQLLARDFNAVACRTDEQHVLVGRLLSTVLLIESKLVRLLSRFDAAIDDRTFGRKLDVFKDFLRVAELKENGLEINDYRVLLGPLNEIKVIRNGMAHDLDKVDIAESELSATFALIKSKRPDLSVFDNCETESLKSIAAVTVFAFVFCSEIARLQMVIA